MGRKGGKAKPHPRQLANPTNWVKNLSSKHSKYFAQFSIIKCNQMVKTTIRQFYSTIRWL